MLFLPVGEAFRVGYNKNTLITEMKILTNTIVARDT